ncbi:MAG: aldo/keto reductase [Psychroflexus halocasei]|uniref:aldo/keto reductase n=1 Tax=Psychroflexus sp. S27 TaxID=1982757 RepID=UPI000C2B2C2F|nr:aldo/keto reductase [Psychroflexus sp. S27]PJX20734.1 aldehyde oxidoreductase [Psychroflexus sp. S27]
MKSLKFRNGDQIAQIGLGTWKSKDGLVGEAVKTAVKSGYTHIDCAATYGNEAEIGEALTDLFDAEEVNREDIFITSKLWNNAHKKEDVIPALKQTLSDLNLDHLDLYLIHWPVAFKPGLEGMPQSDEDYVSLKELPIIDTWAAMVEAKKQGLVKHIGVSNFSIKKLKDLMSKTDENPEMNQVELHPYLHQDELINFCHENDILVTAFSPLGSQDRIPEMKADNEPSLLENPVVNAIAEKHDVSAAQVLLNFHLQRNCIVIPKSTNADRIKQNLKAANFDLTQDDMKELKTLDKHFRYVNGKFFETSDGKYENIYDE